MKLHRYGAFSQINAPINIKEARRTQQEELDECRKKHRPQEPAETVLPQAKQPEVTSEPNAEVVSEAPASPTPPRYPPKTQAVVSLADEIFPDGL